MKILFVHQYFLGMKAAGGTRHYEFAKYLVSKGHAVTVLASAVNPLTGDVPEAYMGKIFSEERVDNIRIIRPWTYFGIHKSFIHRIFSFLSFMMSSALAGAILKNAEFVFATSPPLFQALSGYIISHLKRTAFIFEVRDLWPEFAIDMGILKNKTVIGLARALESFLYRRAKLIIINSPGFRQYISRRVSDDKIVLIPNSVDVEMFSLKSDGEAIRQQYGFEGKFVVLYSGAHGMANNLETIIQTANILREHQEFLFVFVGDGKEKANLVKLKDSLALNNVLFIDAQPKERMPQFLAAADVCVVNLMDIPMFRTVYPNKVFDYMASGKPTILGIDGVIREVIDAAQGGIFVKPGNPQEMASAALKLYRDEELRRTMGENARKYVVEHFDRKKIAEQLEETLETLR